MKNVPRAADRNDRREELDSSEILGQIVRQPAVQARLAKAQKSLLEQCFRARRLVENRPFAYIRIQAFQQRDDAIIEYAASTFDILFEALRAAEVSLDNALVMARSWVLHPFRDDPQLEDDDRERMKELAEEAVTTRELQRRAEALEVDSKTESAADRGIDPFPTPPGPPGRMWRLSFSTRKRCE